MKNSRIGRRVTLADVASKTGYTVNTVSRALKDKSDISRATCEHIQRVAKEMGYVRNSLAGALRSGRTRTIGLIVGEVSNPYYAIMADEIHNAALALGYSVTISCSRDDPTLEMRQVEALISNQVDGVLLFPCSGSAPTIVRLRAAGVPFVLMSRCLSVGESDCVMCDEEDGAYLATRHLIENGHRKLAFLSHADIVYAGDMRLRGFFRACDEAGIPEIDRRVAICGDRVEATELLTQWHAQGVTGAFMFCDMEAWSVIALLGERGLRVPDDLAFVGFDNIQGTLSFPSPLCSIECHMPAQISAAVDLLRKRIHHSEIAPQTIVFPVELICRGSCGRGH